MYALLVSATFSLFSYSLQVAPYVLQVAPWIGNNLGLAFGGAAATRLFSGRGRRGLQHWTSSWSWWILKRLAFLFLVKFPLTSLYMVSIGLARCWFFGVPTIALSWLLVAEVSAIWVVSTLLAGFTKHLLLCLAGLVKKAFVGGICAIFGVVQRAIFWPVWLALKAVVGGVFGMVKWGISGTVLWTCKFFVRAAAPMVDTAKVCVSEDEVDGLSGDGSSVETVAVIAPLPRRSPRNLKRVNYKE